MNYISIKNLTFNYDKKKIFNDISLKIKEGSLTGILSSNSSGKSTLLKIISGDIFIDGISKSQEESIMFTSYTQFYSKTVYDELMLASNSYINKIKKLLKEFNLLDKINESPSNLNYIETQKLNFIKGLLKNAKIFLMDDIFSYFDKYSKIEFIGIIKKYQYDNNITVIFTSSSLDDAIFCDNIVMIDDGKIIYDGSVDNIYLDEKKLKSSNVNISMFNELLDKLKLYGIVNDNVCTIDEVVGEICK